MTLFFTKFAGGHSAFKVLPRLLLAPGAAVLCLLLAACGGTGQEDASKKGKKGGGRGGDNGPVQVVAAKSVRKDVPIEMSAVGNVEAYSTVSVRPQVSGQLEQVFVEDGQYIKKGQKLFQIDERPLQAQVAQMEATLARDRAQLGQAQANLARDVTNEKYAREQADRYAALFKQGVVSRDDQDRFGSTADALAQSVIADRAAIESAQAQIQADQANVDNMKLQLSFTTIYSTLDGRAGNVTVKAGNIVTANQTELMSIAQVAPIYVTFSVPEGRLGEIQRYMAERKLPVTVTSQDNAMHPEAGVLTFVDNNVDSSTGTIKLKGTFQNSARLLWPGEYVDVRLKLSTLTGAIVIPSAALQTGQDGTYVYVVKEDHSAEIRPVKPGVRRDPEIVVSDGLEEGETVVTEGQLRIGPNSRLILPGENGGRKGGAKKT